VRHKLDKYEGKILESNIKKGGGKKNKTKRRRKNKTDKRKKNKSNKKS
jgi:hypothetical protein